MYVRHDVEMSQLLPPGSPEWVYVTEVARTCVDSAARGNGLWLLGKYCLERVRHQAEASLIEQERVVVGDGARCDVASRGDVNLEKNRHGRIHRLEVHAYSRIVIGLPDVLGVVEPKVQLPSALT